MQFQIEVLSATTSQVPTAKGSYGRMEVAFKKDGKIEGKTLMDFAAKEAFKALSGAQQGQVFTITSEKEAGRDGKEYWVWKNAVQGSAGQAAQAATGAVATPVKSSGSTYATAEERAKTQVYIVRQSSLTNAIKYYELTGHKKATTEDVLGLAQTFTNFIFEKEPEPSAAPFTGSGFQDMESDIPL